MRARLQGVSVHEALGRTLGQGGGHRGHASRMKPCLAPPWRVEQLLIGAACHAPTHALNSVGCRSSSCTGCVTSSCTIVLISM